MREIRLSGSVRGVRRNPYPYRDTPKPDAEGSVLLKTTLNLTAPTRLQVPVGNQYRQDSWDTAFLA
jgi:hypothetical protein